MEITNGEIYDSLKPLADICRIKLPIKVSYKLAKLAQELDPHAKTVQRLRTELVQEYGQEDPTRKGQFFVLPDSPNFPKFKEELDFLMEQVVDVNFQKVKLPEMVASTCDKCHHNMDKSLEIETVLLLQLSSFLILD